MRYLICLLLLTGCDASLTQPSQVSDLIRSEWAIAQQLSSELVGAAAFNVHPEQFKIVERPDVFECAGKPANGCFSHGFGRTPTIQWNVKTPTVIRHEAQHAILWKLKHPDFKCVEHGC